MQLRSNPQSDLNWGERATLRRAAIFLDRYRTTIEAEVDRRLGRAQPPPHARAEIVRRFRSFSRLASADIGASQPSLEGLGGNSSAALERAVQVAVDVALLCGAPQDVARCLRDLEARFRSGIRRAIEPGDAPQPDRKRRRQNPARRRRVRAAIDRIGDAYVALCLETGRVYDLNPAAEALFGRDAAGLLELSFAELIEPSDRGAYEDLAARLEGEESTPPVDLCASRPDGTRIPIELSVASHRIGGRRLAIFVLRERTARA
jgi:PAS domain S-box-containing protein